MNGSPKIGVGYASADSRATPASAAGGIILTIGGGLVAIQPLVDTAGLAGFVLSVSCIVAGFALIGASSFLVTALTPLPGWLFHVVGSMIWVVASLWFLHLGSVFNVPTFGWGVVAALAYLVSSAIYFVRADRGASVITFVLFAGSLGSTVIAYNHPVFASPATYLPVAAAAAIGGLIGLASSRLRRSRRGLTADSAT
ncbi:hypothetical protein ACFUTX_02485 [Microbacterium sp. NPDC057407]|uniref:hypothetical protein n=1 Tax=Microbacterium sp. NPDC057407 TaxID=3346120 RepID=UPI003671C726